ncbi:DNA-binding transcriptional regulator, AcrR family [Tenacibaculum sp. MAR_2009_124]|uniref:TetR/AcrR family transcriptional regulator n=1 Tax=Tenacibaculum sp. MAR_2009_124 TaxID=1250059 RepID=UPI00089995DD|nr:TetR/AcrR family transcriptional regulator [Tenacibaculum sp. MAR_2009_124]SEC84710.1 DNA-binding transcriptional regulator, AcrR family [Tenacibaculum sp. MAR_2009_124]
MGRTKDRIIETAISLFNEHGLSKITLRTIAKEMGISQGNLNYHFKKREDIIESIYFQMVDCINNEILELVNGKIKLNLLIRLNSTIANIFYEFRFFMLDFTQIMREHAKIKEHYIMLTDIRQEQFHEILKVFIVNGIIRREELVNEYLNLYKRIQIIGDFWFSHASIEKELSKNDLKDNNELIMQSLYPYLTDKGKEEFFSLKVSKL